MRSVQKSEILRQPTASIARAEEAQAKLAQQELAWEVERSRTKKELYECY